jgi:hypothetical protein
MSIQQPWQIIYRNTPYVDDSNWIEEEDRLLHFAENPIFEKQSLDNIAFVFIYTDLENNIVGASRTTAPLNKRVMSSILRQQEFTDKVNTAKTPSNIFKQIDTNGVNDWMEKQYVFNDANIYCVPVDSDNISDYQPLNTFKPLQFSKDVTNISSSLIPFHELYEILIIMREEKPFASIKSILKDGTTRGKTKKVRISDELPNKFVYSRFHGVVAGKRRTKKVHN